MQLYHEDTDTKLELLAGKVVFIEIGRRAITLAITPAWAKRLLCTPMDTLATSLLSVDPYGVQVTEEGHSVSSDGLRIALWTDAEPFNTPSTVAVFSAGYYSSTQ